MYGRRMVLSIVIRIIVASFFPIDVYEFAHCGLPEPVVSHVPCLAALCAYRRVEKEFAVLLSVFMRVGDCGWPIASSVLRMASAICKL